MPKLDFMVLGNCILHARKELGLTQKELAAQTGLSIKTVQDIEKGRKNPTYGTLVRLVVRLGISPDALFPSKVVIPTDTMQQILGSVHSCNPRNQNILLKTVHFLSKQLCEIQDKSD